MKNGITTCISSPLKVIDKLKKHINNEQIGLNKKEIKELESNETMSDVVIEKICRICSQNNISLNTIFLETNISFALVPYRY